MNSLAPTTARPLRRQPTDDLRKPLLVLFSAYPVFNSTPQADEARAAAYLLGLSELPEWAVSEAVRRFVQGKVERRNRDKLPTAEQVAAEARELVDAEARRRVIENNRLEQARLRKQEREFAENRAPAEERARLAAEIMARHGLKNME